MTPVKFLARLAALIPPPRYPLLPRDKDQRCVRGKRQFRTVWRTDTVVILVLLVDDEEHGSER
jgi:hypothetical protein